GAALAGWKGSMPYARIDHPAPAKVAGGREVIKTPDKANAMYSAGLVLPLGDEHPDYPALVLANYILGGGSLASRLGDRVRQKEGLSYGVYSGFAASPLDRRATLTVGAIYNPVNAAKVEQAIREEVDRLWREGVTQEELDRAKQGYLQQQRVGRASDS